jgi:cell division protein ZapB
MLEQLDALATRIQELVSHVRQLREENHRLRTELATAQTEAGNLRERVTVATERLDRLIDGIPE